MTPTMQMLPKKRGPSRGNTLTCVFTTNGRLALSSGFKLALPFLEYSTRRGFHPLCSLPLPACCSLTVTTQEKLLLAQRPRSSTMSSQLVGCLSYSNRSRFSRCGAERHDRRGRGRCPAPSASQGQHGRLWESDGKPGRGGLLDTSTPSSTPEGKWGSGPRTVMPPPWHSIRLPEGSGFAVD